MVDVQVTVDPVLEGLFLVASVTVIVLGSGFILHFEHFHHRLIIWQQGNFEFEVLTLGPD